ncbi:MAG: toll/interleukin-1 receptor domain-containing protein [Ktedonobacteraceae bacterium]|nr:toll/interleukin-1 receptor domain-containing protein [Ktedonobacteraceae bacterium]
MADQQQIEQINQGVDAWNLWKMENRYVEVDFSNADFSYKNLSKTDLRYLDGGLADDGMASLFGIDLSYANLTGANLSYANLTGANLSCANLTGANLNGTNLEAARMTKANLTSANLTSAHLIYVDFSCADLTNANLASAHLLAANFNTTTLSNANFEDTYLLDSNFAGIDLRTVRGLEKIQDRQDGPWTIGIDTLVLSHGNIPSTFLKSAGVPDSLIEYATSLLSYAIEYYTCFISYSSKDEMFAKRLHADLQAKGVRCWFAPHDMKTGDKLRDRIDQAIHLHEKLLLILSKHALASDWVEAEVETALEKEQRQHRLVLFPVRIDDEVMHTTRAWAALLRRTRHICDLTHWSDPHTYQYAFERLLRDLRGTQS